MDRILAILLEASSVHYEPQSEESGNQAHWPTSLMGEARDIVTSVSHQHVLHPGKHHWMNLESSVDQLLGMLPSERILHRYIKAQGEGADVQEQGIPMTALRSSMPFRVVQVLAPRASQLSESSIGDGRGRLGNSITCRSTSEFLAKKLCTGPLDSRSCHSIESSLDVQATAEPSSSYRRSDQLAHGRYTLAPDDKNLEPSSKLVSVLGTSIGSRHPAGQWFDDSAWQRYTDQAV